MHSPKQAPGTVKWRQKNVVKYLVKYNISHKEITNKKSRPIRKRKTNRRVLSVRNFQFFDGVFPTNAVLTLLIIQGVNINGNECEL